MAVGKATVEMKNLKFDKNGIVPVVVQDYESGEVLSLSYVNAEALEKTLSTGYAHYVDRAKKAVYKHVNAQKVKALFVNDDSESLLMKVDPKQTITEYTDQTVGEYNTIGGEMFGRLQRIIADVKKNPEDGAYTSFLFVRGIDRIGKKVGEEAVELVIAAKNDEKNVVVSEAADLLYHVMVLLNVKGVKISEVCAELCKRNR